MWTHDTSRIEINYLICGKILVLDSASFFGLLAFWPHKTHNKGQNTNWKQRSNIEAKRPRDQNKSSEANPQTKPSGNVNHKHTLNMSRPLLSDGNDRLSVVCFHFSSSFKTVRWQNMKVRVLQYMFAEKKFGLRVEQFSYITFIQPVFTGRPLLPPSCVCGKSASTPYTSPKFKIFQLNRFDQTAKSDAKMQQANPLEKHMFKLETEDLYNIH